MSRKLPEIKQRKDGYFEQKVTISPNNRKSVYGATKAEVRRKARELIAEAMRYDISNVKKMTVIRHFKASHRHIFIRQKYDTFQRKRNKIVQKYRLKTHLTRESTI